MTFNSRKKKPNLAITLGDPLGIGSEIVSKALDDPKIKNLAHWTIFGSPSRSNHKLSPRDAGHISWEALNAAVDSIRIGACDGLVTAPVSKTHLQKAGFPYPGQTEYLAHSFQTKKVHMMLASPQFKVVLVTIHIPLKKVFTQLKTEKIFEAILETHRSLQQDFGITSPRVAVCGLNPHAGENGLMGDEEKKTIMPAIRKALRRKIQASGPWPSDTVFHQAKLGKFDAVVCHYHDQGLIALKTLSFDEGVNTTLGLPIVRTSPDHGCAFDIVGQNKANPSSMKFAMRMAVDMWRNRRTN